MINRVFLLGVVTRDVQTKLGEKNNEMAKFGVQTIDGKFKEFHTVNAFGFVCEQCKTLNVGDIVAIEGKITTKRYEVKGERKYFTSIVAKHIEKVYTDSIDSHKILEEGSNEIKQDSSNDEWLF